MKIEFELKKPDYDRVTYHGLRILLHIIVWGFISWIPSAIAGELYYTYLVNRWDFPMMSSKLTIPLTMLSGLATIVLFMILFVIVVTIGEKIFNGGQLVADAYKRYDKKQWMSDRDNEGKCIFCRHYHHAENKYCDHGLDNPTAKPCSCSVYKPLKFIGTHMKMVVGEAITGRVSSASFLIKDGIGLTAIGYTDGITTDRRYCTDCGKTFEVEKSNITDICESCATDKVLRMTPYKRGGYKATPSLKATTPPLPPDYTQDDFDNQLICLCGHKWGQHTEKGNCTRGDCEYFIIKKEVNDGTICLYKHICSHANFKYSCECDECREQGEAVFYWCQLVEHQKLGRPHNSWTKTTKESHECLLPDDCTIHSTGWHCECEDCVGRDTDVVFTYYCQLKIHREVGRPHRSWEKKKYFECPGCESEGETYSTNKPKKLRCLGKWSDCDILYWDITTGKTYDNSENEIVEKYLNCPGCGKKGNMDDIFNSDEMTCSSSVLKCNIYHWNKHTNEVTNKNE